MAHLENKSKEKIQVQITSKNLDSYLPSPVQNFDPTSKGVVGLRNLGNTCYFNSTIQCLSHTIPLTSYFLTGKFRKYILNHLEDTEKVSLLINYLNLLKNVWGEYTGFNEFILDLKRILLQKVCNNKFELLEGELERRGGTEWVTYAWNKLSDREKVLYNNRAKKRSVIPKSFLDIFLKLFPEGGVFRQNDAQESIVFLLDTFHELISRKVTYNVTGKPQNEFDQMMLASIKEWADHYNNTHSFIIDLFSGQEHLRLECQHCHKITHKYPPFMYTCLPVNDKTRTIYNCFDRHCKVEQLDEENAWKCDNCQQKTRAYKKTAYWKFPQILIVSLNRFQIKNYGRGQYGHVKQEEFIEYPLVNLDLSDYITNPEDTYLYDLYAVCCHTGSTNFGHYYSYCLKPDGTWYKFNDQHTTKIDNLSKVITEDAYVLFYYKTASS